MPEYTIRGIAVEWSDEYKMYITLERDALFHTLTQQHPSYIYWKGTFIDPITEEAYYYEGWTAVFPNKNSIPENFADYSPRVSLPESAVTDHDKKTGLAIGEIAPPKFIAWHEHEDGMIVDSIPMPMAVPPSLWVWLLRIAFVGVLGVVAVKVIGGIAYLLFGAGKSEKIDDSDITKHTPNCVEVPVWSDYRDGEGNIVRHYNVDYGKYKASDTILLAKGKVVGWTELATYFIIGVLVIGGVALTIYGVSEAVKKSA